MKIGTVIKNTALGAGYIGLICYGGIMATEAFEYVKKRVKEHKSKKWKEGYDEATKDYKARIDYLTKRNEELMKEAYRMTEAAE